MKQVQYHYRSALTDEHLEQYDDREHCEPQLNKMLAPPKKNSIIHTNTPVLQKVLYYYILNFINKHLLKFVFPLVA